MKNIINIKTSIIFVITIILYGVSSCSDATEIIQEGELTEANAFQSIEDLQLGLNGIYNSYSITSQIYFNAITTDNLKKGSDSFGQGADEYNFELEPGSSFPFSIYVSKYSTINAVNRLIRAMSSLTFTGNDLIEFNHIKAQALAFRAMAHFELFQYFTSDYKSPNTLAITVVDFVPDPNDVYERNTVAETLSFIKDDLDNAELLFDLNNENIDDPIYIGKDFIKALRTRIALTEGDYLTAEILAGELIADNPLANATEYENLFTDFDDQEVIFKLKKIVGNSGIASLFYFNNVELGGGHFLEMSNQLYNEFEAQDVRLSVNLNGESVVNGVNDPTNILLINKYPGSGEGPLINDIKVFRSSEMLLIRAEAEARNGNLLASAASIQELRNARYGGGVALPVYSDLQSAITDIFNERRKELCYEGHRYLDFKRLGKEFNIDINRLAVDCGSFDAQCTLDSEDYRFTLPIPQNELNINNVITQNSGY